MRVFPIRTVFLTRPCSRRLLSSSKLETGLTGLPASATARADLLRLYDELATEATAGLPPSYAYRSGLLATLSHRCGLLQDLEGRTDLDVEREIGEGQLEELIEQGKAELELVRRVKEWRPWES